MNNDLRNKILELHKHGKTTKQIAAELKISMSTVYRYLEGLQDEISKQTDELRKKALLLYKEGKTVKEISKILKKSEGIVYEYLKRMNAGIKTKEESAEENRKKAIKLYTQDKLTMKEIANRLGIAIATLYKYLKSEGIPLREKSTGLNMREEKTRVIREETFEVYLSEGKSISKTANKLGVSENTIRNRLKKQLKTEEGKPRKKEQIQTKTKNENKKIAIELRQEGKTVDEIAEILGVSDRTVFSYLKGIDVPKREKTKNKTIPRKTQKDKIKPNKPAKKKSRKKEFTEIIATIKKTYQKPTIEKKQEFKEPIEKKETIQFPQISDEKKSKIPETFLVNYRNICDKIKAGKLQTQDINNFWKSIKVDRKIAEIFDAVFISRLYEHIKDIDSAKKVLLKELEDWNQVRNIMKKRPATNPIMQKNYEALERKINQLEEKIQTRWIELSDGKERRTYTICFDEK